MMRSSKPTIRCWYEFASTYSYIAVHRAPTVAAAEGVALEWRAFLLGPIFARAGWQDSPFNIYAAKGKYMWRDMERLCERYAIPFRRPSGFPRNGVLAARVASANEAASWYFAFVQSVFRANFFEDRDISRPEVVEEILEDLKLDAAAIIVAADAGNNKSLLRKRTEEASALGIFGAPTFTVDGELFWGSDRLEDALEWIRRRPEAPA